MTVADKRWAQLADDNQFTRLDTIRKTADSWRTGLIALTALFTAVTIIKGPEKASDLSGDGRAIAGILLGASLLLLLTGSLLAMMAAYGLPGANQLVTGQRLRTWSGTRAEDAKRQLKLSIACFFLAVIGIAAAIAVTWFDSDWFPSGPAGVIVVDQKPTGGQSPKPVCGELKSLDGQSLVLKVKGAAGEKADTPVPLETIQAVAVKDSCPK
jgi:hypothetical protein